MVGGRWVSADGEISPGQNPFLAWHFNPLVLLGLFFAGYLYGTGLQRWQRPSHPVRLWQRVSFFAGLAILFVALQSPIDAYAEQLFWVHQVQHILLRMLAPLLMLLGAPLTPMLRGLRPWALRGIVRPVVRNQQARKLYGFLTHPATAALLFLAVMYFWQLPGPHNLALKQRPVHYLMHLTMLGSGLVFWWLIIDPKPHRSPLPFGLRVLYLALVTIPNTFLGAFITFANHLLYTGYAGEERVVEVSLLVDQQVGGLILWILGDMMSLLAAGVVMVLWVQHEEAKEPKEPAEVPVE